MNTLDVNTVSTTLREVKTLQECVRVLEDVTKTRLYHIYSTLSVFDLDGIYMTERETAGGWLRQYSLDLDKIRLGRMPHQRVCVAFNITSPHERAIAEKMYRYLRLLLVRILEKLQKSS